MKEFVLTIGTAGNTNHPEFDSLDEAIKEANKRQKTRKHTVLVLQKDKDNPTLTMGDGRTYQVYKTVYNAKGNPLGNCRSLFPMI